MADRAGHSRSSKARARAPFTSRSRSTSPTCRRSTSSTRCRAAGCTSSIRSTTSSSASSASPKDQFSLELVDAPKDIYTLEALDAGGPRRPYRRVQPEVRRARVPRQVSRLVARRGHDRLAHGARSTAQTAIDARIQTDPERFWDHYQAKILPRIYDHVMKVTDNRPMPDKQPFHRDLDVEVWMSEPDFRIGVDEELVSSLESLHEDLYFVTLDFFDALGPHDDAAAAGGAGQDLPDHPSRAARASRARCACCTPATRRRKPQLEVRVPAKGGAEARDGAPRSRQDRHERAAGAARGRARRRGQRDRAAGRGEGRSRGGARRRCARRARRACTRRASSRRRCRYDRVDRVAARRSRSAMRARGACVRHDRRLRRRRNVRTAAAQADARRSSRGTTSSAPTNPRQIVGKLAAYPEVKAYKAGVVVSRPRHLGDGDHAAGAGRAGVARQADRAQADDLHHRPAARQRGVVDEPHPAARRAAGRPIRATATS